MVCLGNICRSPLAEGVLRHKLNERNITHIAVDSAGTSGWHAGENPDPRSVQNAAGHGIDISKLRSRQFTVQDFDEFHYIFVMDQSNYDDVLSLARHEEDRQKVDLLLNAAWPGKNLPVPDPYYGGEAGFEKVFSLVSEACDALIENLIIQHENR